MFIYCFERMINEAYRRRSRSFLLAAGQERPGVQLPGGHRPLLVRPSMEPDAHRRHLRTPLGPARDRHLHRPPVLGVPFQRQGEHFF